MKTLTVLIVAIGCVLSAHAQTRSVLEMGPHHTLYSSSDGNPGGAPMLVLETGLHYWSAETKEWLPADPRFSINATRDAFVANKTLGQLRLSAQINTAGAITVNLDPQDPTRQLVTSPVAIALEEPATGARLVVATITNSIGAPVEGSANQIIYEDCFAGVCASYVVEVQRGTYSADVLFTGKFDVRDWGFTTNARVQVISEIYGPPPDSSIRRPLYIEQNQQKVAQAARLGLSLDVIDETLCWGNLVMAEGSAYTAATATATNGASVRVAKQIENGDGRLFLVESLAFASLQQQFLKLPECKPPSGHASLNRPIDARFHYAAVPRPPSSPIVAIQTASEPSLPSTGPKALLPPPTLLASRITHHALPSTAPEPILPLQARLAHKPAGVCVDYIANLGGTLSTPVTFQSSTNILITGSLILNGAVTIEPVVVKYKANASMQINSTLTMKNFGQFRGAQFTAVDDNSVGDTCAGIPGSGYTGVIANTGYANPAIYASQSSLSLTNCRFSYAKLAVQCITPLASSSSFNFSHSQLVNCITGIQLSLASSGCGCGCGGGGGCGFGCGVTIALAVNNCLMANVGLPFNICLANPPLSLTLGDCTLDRATRIAQVTSGGFGLYAANSIFANITNTSSGVTFGGTHNGFYHSAQQFGTSQFVVANSPFLSVGAGNYYLSATSGFTNAGTTTGIPAWLPADLRLRTTCPPTVICDALLTNSQILSPQVPRDTNVCSLGMHYDPIDWALGWVLVTNATLTVNPGTVIAAFGTNAGGTNVAAYGLAIGQNAALQCQGAPTTPNWFVAYNTVQEQGTNSGGWLPPSSGLLLSEFQGLSPGSAINCRFTDWSVPSLDEPGFNAVTNTGPLSFQDCEFHGGKLLTSRPTIDLANCLLERVYANLSSADTNAPYIRNCLFYGGTFNFAPNVTNALVKDNLFDQTLIPTNTAIYTTYDGGYNAYVANNAHLLPWFPTDQILTGTPAYQTGLLGNYYYPTNGPSGGLTNLFDTGSAWALDDGLFYYTTTTNQVPEGGTKGDIGYHYVAIDPNTGQPDDWDHDGLPDYLYDAGSFFESWLIQYFGRTDLDPYSLCPSNSWTILQCCQNGWNPYSYCTPPPPQSVAALLDSTGTNAVITWTSGGGPIVSYQLLFGSWSPSVDTNTFSITYNGIGPGAFGMNYPFTVRAWFANGDHADSQPVFVQTGPLSPSMAAIRGPAGLLYLVMSPVPTSFSAVRIYWWNGVGTSSIDLSAAAFVNGVAPLPVAQMTGYSLGSLLDVQCISPNGNRGAIAEFYPFPELGGGEKEFTASGAWNFVDARRHLKENLKFLLCSATLHQPFSYGPGDGFGNGLFDAVWSPETYFARPPSPTGYEYDGFHTFSSDLNYSVMQELRPAQENHLWRNFAYDPGDFDASGQWTNGVGYERDLPGFRQLYAPKYELACTNCDPLPLALSVTTYPYLYARFVTDLWDQQFSDDLAEIGIGVSGTNIWLASGLLNIYGLPLASVLYNSEYPSGARQTVNAGGASAGWYGSADYFCKVQPPILQTVGYYFASQTRYLNWELNGWIGPGPLAGPAPPLPGSPTFSETNTSPLLITGFGQPITVSGWAKQTITSPSNGKYAYLEQCFDQAYTIDGNGSVTTNSAGVLSPYGEFLPIMPGAMALVTMPDIDTGERGTGIVSVIKLQLDVNHDGIMDLSFAGPDNTSQARPYLFWVNNDHDEPGNGSNPDSDLSTWGSPPANAPDYLYGDIRCARNLEDFARLWLCGIPELPSSQGYGVTLTLNALSGSPAINLYLAYETNGGTLYLTNGGVAAAMVTDVMTHRSLFNITNGATYALPTGYFDGSNKYFLFEGAGAGSGELVLTVSQGTNLLAQTSAWLDLHDIKDFIEQARITNVVTTFPAMRDSTNTSAFTIDQCATVPPADDDKRIIVLVHGWNNGTWQSESYAETMFKRLWWQGYRGRFVAFRWPTLSGETDPWTSVLTYNRSEYIAFRSAVGASGYFDSLRARFPDYTINVCAHSMGNIVMLETLKLQLAGGSHSIDNYVLMEAAVPAHCYDTNAAVCPGLYTTETPPQTPDTYRGYPGAINGALRGRMTDFLNTNDFALAAWVGNQLLNKPDGGLGYYIVPALQPYRLLNTPVTDPRETMAFVARPRSYAVGAQPGVHGVILGTEVDLAGRFGFGDTAADHSGQFTRAIQQVWGFYSTLLQTFNGTQP